MKPAFFLRSLLGFLLLAAPLCATAQELPAASLQLPPVPTKDLLLAKNTRPPGLPGSASSGYVSSSHLTLPEKPALTALITYQASPSAESEPVPNLQAPAPVPPDLLQPAPNPLLPGLPDSVGDLPLPGADPTAPTADLLPVPGDSPVTPGFIELHNAPEEPLPVPAPAAAFESTTVLASDLAPAPEKTADTPDPNARGPLFRIKGTEACLHTRALGYRFTPAQGQGRRDGIHTVASQVPNVLTSEVHGPRMMQMRPSPLWTTPYIENTFYMFCDGNFNAVRLQPGWKIRGIQLKGPNWQWLTCPKSGANTASFSIRIRAWKTVDTPAQGSVVTLEGLTLEGPPGATDWKAAFPSLLKSSVMSAKR